MPPRETAEEEDVDEFVGVLPMLFRSIRAFDDGAVAGD